jgi:hypothetical protein
MSVAEVVIGLRDAQIPENLTVAERANPPETRDA